MFLVMYNNINVIVNIAYELLCFFMFSLKIYYLTTFNILQVGSKLVTYILQFINLMHCPKFLRNSEQLFKTHANLLVCVNANFNTRWPSNYRSWYTRTSQRVQGGGGVKHILD